MQDKRAKIKDSIENKSLHDYVPFYFAPRSPMLLVNHRNGIQEEIIYLITTAQDINVGNLKYVFSDRHPVLRHVQFFDELSFINKIKWDLFFEDPLQGWYSKYWNSSYDKPAWIDRKEIRQAEFLIFQQLPWEFIRGIATINKTVASKVQKLFNNFNIEVKIEIMPKWYY